MSTWPGVAGRPVRLLMLVAAVLLTGCSPRASDVALPPAAPAVEAQVTEHGVVYEGPVPAGRVVFRIENAGDQPHQLSLLALAEGTPSIEEQLRDPPEEAPVMVARVPVLGPGETGMFAAPLAEGQRYALVDMSEAPDGALNAEMGVATEFRAGGQPRSTTLSKPRTAGLSG